MYWILAMSAILWGGNVVTAKYVVAQLDPFWTIFLRFLAVSILLLLYTAYLEGKKLIPNRNLWPGLLAMGATGIFLCNVCFFVGIRETTATNASLIMGLNPSTTAVLAYLLLREKVNSTQWCGIFLSLAGVLFLVTKGSWHMIENWQLNRGDLIIFTGQISWALYTILGRKVMAQMSSMAATTWSSVIGTIMLGIIVGYFNIPLDYQLGFVGTGCLIYMIIGSGLLAFYWWNKGVQGVGVHKAAVFANLIPLFGVVLSVIFLGEKMEIAQGLGGIFILCGLALTTQMVTPHFLSKPAKI